MITKVVNLSICILLFPVLAFAGLIKGKIFDAATNEPLVGANILIKGTKFGTASNLDGSYVIKGLQAGNFEIQVQFVGYQAITKTIVLKSSEEQLTIDFSLLEKGVQLQEAVVTAKNLGESEEASRKSEQKSNNILNILSAKTIELLPDITVGNLLQRVSGVSVVRNSSGDGQYAVIRGMDKRYNYTMVNGIKIPSPDDKNRYIPMDIFPANLLGRLEVIKALTPNLEGDAIGGAMNMVMKSVPDYLIVSATASGGYGSIFNNQDFQGFDKSTNLQAPSEVKGLTYQANPTDFSINTLQYKKVELPINSLYSFSIGNRLFNHKLGFLVGASYQMNYRGSRSAYFSLNAQPSPDPQPNTPIFESVQNRTYSNKQARLGINLKLDYNLSEKSKLSFNSVFMQMEDWQHRHLLSNQLTQYGDVGNDDRSVYRIQTIQNFTLQGEHNPYDNLNATWSLAYSKAGSKTPDWTNLNVTYRTSLGIDGKPVETAKYVDNISHIWTHNEDKDVQGFIHLNYKPVSNLEISTGGMFRTKNRYNYYNDYALSTVLPGGVRQVYNGIEKVIFSFYLPSYAYADSTNANNYSATEDIQAAYLQGKYTFNKLQLLGGIRFENTVQTYKSKLPETAVGKNGKVSYLDMLPSLHVKYALSNKENLRLSYFKGITRPGYFELVPALFPGEYFNESGNYNLKHTIADNIDLRYEIFPSANEQFLVGAFYKNIVNPIEFGFNTFGNNNIVYTPTNFGNATNFGLEMVLSKYYKNWGISANYTYTHSSITTTKKIYGRDSNGSIVNTLGTQTRPLQGQSDHIANVSLIYKNPKIGYDAQLSWVYTGARINIVSPYLGLDYWQRGTSQLDFSSEKQISKNSKFAVFVKMTNLLNNPLIVEVLKSNPLQGLPDQETSEKIVVQKDIIQQTYLLGIRYKL